MAFDIVPHHCMPDFRVDVFASGSVYAAGSIPFIQENLNGTAAVYPGFCVSGVWFCSALSRRCDETGSGARWHLWDIFRKSDFVYSV